MSDPIRDRISKLLNMTTANGCTEDEQETALRMAAAMAMKAGIELDSLRPKDAPKPKAVGRRKNDELKPHQAYAAVAAAELYGIECNVYDLGRGGILFVGREELIELAEETMFWLFRQIESLYKTALPKGMTQARRAEFRKTFKAACAERTLQRARGYVFEIKRSEQRARDETGHNALVVRGHFETLSEEIDEYWTSRFKLTPEQEARMAARAEAHRKWREENPEAAARMDREAERQRKKEERAAARRKGRKQRELPRGIGTEAGWAAGDQVKLRKEVE